MLSSADDDEHALRAALRKARDELGADASAKKLAARVRAEPDAKAEWDTRRVREALRVVEREEAVAALSVDGRACVVGESLFYVSSSFTLGGGVRFVHGQQGVVVEAFVDETNEIGLLMHYPGNEGTIPCRLGELSGAEARGPGRGDGRKVGAAHVDA